MKAFEMSRRSFSGLAVAGLILARQKSSTYDDAVAVDNPAAWFPLSSIDSSVHGGVSTTTLPNGDTALAFDGSTGYAEFADAAALSPATTGAFTIEAWMRPDTLTFSHTESSGYVHWMGKGETGAYEYVSRMYSADNTAGRANRISGYSFNPDGGLGAGSYFQDTLTAGQWIHYALVINPGAAGGSYPNGYTRIYRDGVLRDTDDLSISGQVIVPQRTSAPLRVGTRDYGSFFTGAVGKVAVYDRELPAARIATHHAAM